MNKKIIIKLMGLSFEFIEFLKGIRHDLIKKNIKIN